MNAHLRRTKPAPPPLLVALAGWALPGAGYWLLGGVDRKRGIIIGVTIITLFLLGTLIGGIRVIDVPGFDRAGDEIRIDSAGRRIDHSQQPNNSFYDSSSWAVTSRGFFGEVANKPWYACQILTGPMCLIASMCSLSAARGGIPQVHARLNEIGTLYAAVAGLLNLLAIIDAAHRASATGEQSAQVHPDAPTIIITPRTKMTGSRPS